VVKFDHVAGFVPGSVTFPPQFGATVSVREISLRSSVPLLVTLILNTAVSPVFTVWVSFPMAPSRSALFASVFTTWIEGVTRRTSVSSVSYTVTPLVTPVPFVFALLLYGAVVFGFAHVYSNHSQISKVLFV